MSAAAGDRAALLAALALQRDWGVDETLAEAPTGYAAPRIAAPPPVAASIPLAAPAAPAPAAQVAAAALAAAASDLAALQAAIAAFDGSPLRETATNLVFAAGVPGAAVMLIGDAPGAEEDRAGAAFVGPAGQLLDRMLGSIGLDRGRDVYLANILPWRPPGNRTPTDAEVALFLPFLLRHVALAAPRRLLLLGAIATRALTRSREGISRLRGRWVQITIDPDKTIPALPTLHPINLLRPSRAKADAWADLRLLRRSLDTE